MTVRASKLQLAEACGLSASIVDNSTNVYALMGDAFHGGNAAHYRPNEERFADARAVAFALIGEDRRAEVQEMLDRFWPTWTPPEHARFEESVGITRHGTACEHGDPEAISNGTADCNWEEGEYLVVVDFKSGARAEWNVPEPHDNLQLADYGFALADRYGKSKVKLGLYLAAEGVWKWHEIDLDTPEATKLWERVRGAALHDPTEAVLGAHCSDCWTRLRCPAFILPAISEIDRESALAPLSQPVDGAIEPAKLLRLLNAVKAMEELAEAGKDFAKAYVAEHGPLVVDDQQWGPIPTKGKESTSIAKLKAAGLYDQAVKLQAVTTGAEGKQHRWTKRRDDDKAA